MTDKSAENTEHDWLLAPIGPGEVRLSIEIGQEVELTESARAALATLMKEIDGDEVAGYSLEAKRCSGYTYCTPFGKCTLTQQPNCWSFVRCQIAGS